MEKLNMTKWVDDKDGISSVTLQRDGNKKLIISFQGNLDLYFSLSNFNDDSTFIIGKDNYAVYEIFERLHNNVMNGITFSVDDKSESWMFDEELFEFFEIEGYDRISSEEKDERYRQQALQLAERTGLIQEEEIIWRSDDFAFDIAPYFKITKYPNAYMITFDIPTPTRRLDSYEELELIELKDFISVRIRNSGSHYDMFNVPFMEAYNSLLELPIEYQQIHIEEYLLEQKIKLGEDLEKILLKKYK